MTGRPVCLPTQFCGGDAGVWRVTSLRVLSGAPLAPVDRLEVVESGGAIPAASRWVLRGVTSYERYVTRVERAALSARQEGLGRPRATCAALIPVAKSAAWWNLTQDERRDIFETRSGHIRTGLEYLPAVARRLYHGRELGEAFDFLTWFEFAPGDAAAFDELVGRLRASEEWTFVGREVEVRLEREGA